MYNNALSRTDTHTCFASLVFNVTSTQIGHYFVLGDENRLRRLRTANDKTTYTLQSRDQAKHIRDYKQSTQLCVRHPHAHTPTHRTEQRSQFNFKA